MCYRGITSLLIEAGTPCVQGSSEALVAAAARKRDPPGEGEDARPCRVRGGDAYGSCEH